MFRRFLAVLLTFAAILAAGWLALRRPDIPFETLEAVYAAPESRFITLEPGVSVHYRDEGNSDGPVLVLVHGYGASLHTWKPWVRRLSDEVRIISLDLPGHGLTRTTNTELIGIDGFVSVIDQLADKLDVDTFTLAGNSMGGNTAWSYALEHGDRLDGMILIAASGWARSADGEDDQPLIFKLIGHPVARTLIKDLDLSALVKSGLEDSFADPSFVTDDMVTRYTALSRAPGHRAALLSLSTGGEGRGGASADLMATIDVPTLVIHGDQDAVVRPSGGKRFAETIPGATLMMMENVGHLPQEEAATETAARVRAFIQQHQSEPEAAAPTRIVAQEAVTVGNGSRP